MAVGVLHCPLADGRDATIIRMFARPHSLEAVQHTGVDVKLPGDVHSICAGVVTGCGKDYQGHYAVTVEYDAGKCFRYMHLQSTDIQLGQRVKGGDIIGIPDKYVHFELCQIASEAGSLRFPVRIGTKTYDKVDPIDYVLSSDKLYQGGETGE